MSFSIGNLIPGSNTQNTQNTESPATPATPNVTPNADPNAVANAVPNVQPPQQGQQGQPQQAPTIPQQAGQNVDLAAFIAAQANPQENVPLDEVAFTQSMMSNIINKQNPVNVDINGGPPVLNAQALEQHLANTDLTAGIDMAALEQAFTDGENPAEALRGVLSSVMSSTINSMVPLLNHLAAQVHETALQDSITSGGLQSRSQQIIAEFNNKYNYAANGVASEMLNTFANSLASTSPPNTSPAKLAEMAHMLMSTMSASMQENTNEVQTSNNQQDFTGLL